MTRLVEPDLAPAGQGNAGCEAPIGLGAGPINRFLTVRVQ